MTRSLKAMTKAREPLPRQALEGVRTYHYAEDGGLPAEVPGAGNRQLPRADSVKPEH